MKGLVLRVVELTQRGLFVVGQLGGLLEEAVNLTLDLDQQALQVRLVALSLIVLAKTDANIG